MRAHESVWSASRSSLTRMASSWGILMSGMAEFCLPDLESPSVCVSPTVWISYSFPWGNPLSLAPLHALWQAYAHTLFLPNNLTLTHTKDLIAPHWSKVSVLKLSPGWQHHLKRTSTLARSALSPCTPEGAKCHMIIYQLVSNGSVNTMEGKVGVLPIKKEPGRFCHYMPNAGARSNCCKLQW